MHNAPCRWKSCFQDKCKDLFLCLYVPCSSTNSSLPRKPKIADLQLSHWCSIHGSKPLCPSAFCSPFIPQKNALQYVLTHPHFRVSFVVSQTQEWGGRKQVFGPRGALPRVWTLRMEDGWYLGVQFRYIVSGSIVYNHSVGVISQLSELVGFFLPWSRSTHY